ncbi:MAG: TIGR02757 family protein [Massilibacteroides sp.]|nr:TIGR02757 family protein [Massilibacteroides sp.]MDD4116040.1 TIGR02757 family protein [Massilibacteroides sp.]MDD4660791.1 TIGR02757 family protein [Massilibacteroides sp.]
MVDAVRKNLICWAEKYNHPDFIEQDPIRFPHRYTRKQDIEISGFVTAWISYGRRSLILKKAEELHALWKENPYHWVMQDEKTRIRSCDRLRQKTTERDTCYRFYTYTDFFDLIERLHQIYIQYDSLEEALAATPGDTTIRRIQSLFSGVKGIPSLHSSSACKRLAMFLRWMIRNDGIVDLGIWNTCFSPRELLMPLDTHVFRVSRELGLITHKTPGMAAAIELTENIKTIFPEDPCLADFSLFGYGINENNTEEKSPLNFYF